MESQLDGNGRFEAQVAVRAVSRSVKQRLSRLYIMSGSLMRSIKDSLAEPGIDRRPGRATLPHL
jgi:hypothetical protein